MGGGFIGVEVAENLSHKNTDVVLVERGPQIFPPLDPEIAFCVEQTLVKEGIRVIKNGEVTMIKTSGDGVTVTLSNATTLDADFVVAAAGVKPRSELAVACGLKVSSRGAIVVNAHMQTEDPHIYAVGDVVECHQPNLNQSLYLPLAGPANRQGRLAADHICGRTEARFKGAWGTAVCKIFKNTVAATGVSEKFLRTLKQKDVGVVYVHPSHHAGYYPGAEPMTIKMIFDQKSGAIWGAQAFGGEGLEKRIDVLATAIQAGLTVFDLEDLELCYAPPYSSAKDPVNMLGFVAANSLRGTHEIVTPTELLSDYTPAIAQKSTTLLDVRTPQEFAQGHIPGALNIPIDDLRLRLKELDLQTPILTYCQVGFRGYLSQRILSQLGYKVKNVTGGYKAYGLVTGCRITKP